MTLPDAFDVLVVPPAPPQEPPQSKLKALNYGMQFAHGDLVAI